jgi:hypothetical protein
MPGRGDNNEHGSAGRGSSNQSNQGFTGKSQKQKSNHNKNITGGKASEPSPRTGDADSNRNQPLKDDKNKESQ